MSTKPIYVLGTGLSHDGSACLLKDGEIAVAIEKERLTRRKHDGWNDKSTMQYCLDAEGIKLDDISLVVQNANYGMFAFGNSWYEGERLLTGQVPVVTISHHIAHAYSAFGMCPFDEAAVLVLDGCGSAFDDCCDLDGAEIPERPEGEMTPLWNEKDSYYKSHGGLLKPVIKDFSPWGFGEKHYPMHPPTSRHSIGGVYAAASHYVFQGLEDAGKLMGLAPYGRPGVYDFPIFDLRDGRVFTRYDWMANFRQPAHSFQEFKANFQNYADIAWWIQREVERAILYLVKSRHQSSPSENLCYAGGVALNAVANRRIVTEGPFENVYIQPAAGDNGPAIGCAYFGWLEVLKKAKRRHTGQVYFGKTYDEDSTASTLKVYQALIEFSRSDALVEETASGIAAGNVVGWFQGGAEFGPRALGNRSILADPRLPGVRDRINATVKFREDFRPFAPSVLAEDADVYFECDDASPYMLLVAPVRKEWRDRIPAVVHRDNSARIQTVTRDFNPLYYDLITAFKKATGVGLLLNTSLNRRGTPIVETPDDAMMLFLYSAIDLMVIGNFLVRKRPDFAQRMSAYNRLMSQEAAKKTMLETMHSLGGAS